MFSCSRPECKIFTDASGHWGCGAVYGNQRMHLAWSSEWSQQDIMPKELFPIVLSCVVWGPLILGSRVKFRCDNISVVESVSKGSSREPTVMCCPLPISMSKYSSSFPYLWCTEWGSRCTFKKPHKGVPAVKPLYLKNPCINPNTCANDHCPKENGLDISCLSTAFQTHYKWTSV